ncbi:MAG: hypothetical protein ACK5PB_08220 [Pirellula sp.]
MSQARFPYLIKEKVGKAVLYFGENLADKTYKIPDSIASARLFATDAKGEKREVANNSGIEVFATWDGKHLQDVEVKLKCSEGYQEGSVKTDGEGKVFFTNKTSQRQTQRYHVRNPC